MALNSKSFQKEAARPPLWGLAPALVMADAQCHGGNQTGENRCSTSNERRESLTHCWEYKGMTKFRIPKANPIKPSTPEELFRTLKRSHKVPHLWSHQADLLRNYANHLGKPNIALELPTGAGKSLVGLLVAEFRRQVHDERVAYLCPTRQLAGQVHSQASEYGVPTVLLTGKQKEYPPGDFAAYNTAARIAITTYSGVFNTSPRIDNAQCVILDDAHAAETYIANLWSVQILRAESAYEHIFELFIDVLPDALVFDINNGKKESTYAGSVGIVDPPSAAERADRLRGIMESNPEANFAFAWSVVKEHLGACHIYINQSEVLIRPLWPPSMTHKPFSEATQRVFMSATLGDGGDLERATGVRKIHRLPLPPGWERHGTGRRLILIPDLTLHPEEVNQVAADFAKEPGRLLILTTDARRMGRIENGWLRDSGKQVLHAQDIESGMCVFTDNDAAALVLTNRYDGIDLPDDTCRRMVIDDHPDAINLQEKFLTQRLGANALLRERIRSRVTQAMGRCTRNDRDYATILVLGHRLAKFLTEKNVRASMHPVLQAELDFGIGNSTEQTADGFLTLIAEFRTHEWEAAETHLLNASEEAVRKKDPIADILSGVVDDELSYVYAAWEGDWDGATTYARRVIDQLEGGPELKPYQALWYYVAANATARTKAAFGDEQGRLVDDLLQRAAACAPAISSFLRRSNSPVASPTDDALASLASRNSARNLAKLGHIGSQFSKHAQNVKTQLASNVAATFESGLDALGTLLGFEVGVSVGRKDAAPDSVWTLDHTFVIGWEAKSDETEGGALSVATLRQARGHTEWIKRHFKLADTSGVSIVLTSPRSQLDRSAEIFTDELSYLSTKTVQILACEVARVLGDVRQVAGNASETRVADEIMSRFGSAKLLPRQLLARFTSLGSLPTLAPKERKPGGRQS